MTWDLAQRLLLTLVALFLIVAGGVLWRGSVASLAMGGICGAVIAAAWIDWRKHG